MKSTTRERGARGAALAALLGAAGLGLAGCASVDPGPETCLAAEAAWNEYRAEFSAETAAESATEASQREATERLSDAWVELSLEKSTPDDIGQMLRTAASNRLAVVNTRDAGTRVTNQRSLSNSLTYIARACARGGTEIEFASPGGLVAR